MVARYEVPALMLSEYFPTSTASTVWNSDPYDRGLYRCLLQSNITRSNILFDALPWIVHEGGVRIVHPRSRTRLELGP